MRVNGTSAGRQRATVIVTIVVAAALVVTILIIVSRSSTSGHDARAYPAHRGDTTLAGALGRVHLRIPDCLVDDLRYAVPGPSRDLYLLLSGPDSCMDRFTALNNLTDGGTVSALPRWAVDDRATTLGWQLGPQLGFTLRTGRPAPDHEIEALIRELSDRSAFQAYVRAT